MTSPQLLNAYAATSYHIGGLALRIGRRNARLDALLARLHARRAVLITAANPRSRRMPPPWNDRMTARLASLLRNRTVLPAHSGVGVWRETQFFVVCEPAWAIRLARHFRQNAIVSLTGGRPPALRLIAA